MKQRITIIITLLSLLFSVNTFAEELIETRQLEPFNKIVASNGINVSLRNSNEEKVDVKIENGLLSEVITEVQDGTLKIKLKAQVNSELSVLLVVYYKDLVDITTNKGACISTKDILITDKLNITTNTGGELRAEIQCKDVKASGFGVSTTSLYGWADRLEVKATAGADIFAKTLKSKNVFAKASSGSEVWVKPKNYLEANASMGATIYYTQKPEKINEKVTTGGEIYFKETSLTY